MSPLLVLAYLLAWLAVGLALVLTVAVLVLRRQDRRDARARLALLTRPDVREGSLHG